MQNPAAEQVTKAIKDANNVLVTVRNNPSVDELAAAIALTLMLNHLNKHAITVFSGKVPSTIEFLQPEMAIDTNTDSLRDFIIALDKSKADKLRYKVEDNVVRIFITPYKTSITEKDLEFSQGDFNVDVVVALGVVNKEDFDQAVTAHGRILHDATVVTLTKHEMLSQLGAINWQEQMASSISEMITSIVDGLGENVLDGQIATALLTGIVSETDRFRNANTTPQVMSLSSRLMAVGANQQLIAEKLEEPEAAPQVMAISEEPKANDDGALEIAHDDDEEVSKIHIDDSGNLQLPPEEDVQQPPLDAPEEQSHPAERTYIEPPSPATMFGQDDSGVVAAQPLFEDKTDGTSNFSELASTEPSMPRETGRKVIEPLHSQEELTSEPIAPIALEDPTAPLSTPPLPQTPITPTAPTTPPIMSEPPTSEPMLTPESTPPLEQTLSDLEKAVDSIHAQAQDAAEPAPPSVDEFLGTTRTIPDPQPEPQETTEAPAESVVEQPSQEQPKEEEPPKPTTPTPPVPQPTPQVVNPSAPPAVPPPLMPQANNQPQFFEADGTNSNPFLNPN